MVKKIKICPQCKKWTVGSGEFCGNCGETLIVTEYTDMFFEKLSPIEQQEYVEKAIAGEQIMQEEVHTTESNTSLAVFLTDMVSPSFKLSTENKLLYSIFTASPLQVVLGCMVNSNLTT